MFFYVFLWIINPYSGNRHPLLNWDSKSRLEPIQRKELQSGNIWEPCPASILAILDCRWLLSASCPRNRLRKRFGDPRERDRLPCRAGNRWLGDPPLQPPFKAAPRWCHRFHQLKMGSHRHTSNTFTPYWRWCQIIICGEVVKRSLWYDLPSGDHRKDMGKRFDVCCYCTRWGPLVVPCYKFVYNPII